MADRSVGVEQVVQVPPSDFLTLLSTNHFGHRILNLPPRDLFGVLDVGEVDHSHRPGRIVSQVHVMAIDERTMYTSGYCGCVVGNQFRTRRVGRIVKRYSVLTV